MEAGGCPAARGAAAVCMSWCVMAVVGACAYPPLGYLNHMGADANGEPEARHYGVLDVLRNAKLPGDGGFSGEEHPALLVLVAGVGACYEAVAGEGVASCPRRWCTRSPL